MDEQMTNTQEAEQTTQASEQGTQEQQNGEAAQEKVSALQKFINGLFGAKETDTASSEKQQEGETAADGASEKTFSQADVDAAIEAAKQKWLEEAAEAERIKKLSPEEKAAEEQKKSADRIAELEGQLLQKDLRESATKKLEADGFPVGLADVLDYSSKERMEETLSNTTKIFKDSLAAAIKERLRGKTPEGLGAAASSMNLFRDQIAKNIRGL